MIRVAIYALTLVLVFVIPASPNKIERVHDVPDISHTYQFPGSPIATAQLSGEDEELKRLFGLVRLAIGLAEGIFHLPDSGANRILKCGYFTQVYEETIKVYEQLPDSDPIAAKVYPRKAGHSVT